MSWNLSSIKFSSGLKTISKEDSYLFYKLDF